MFAVSGSEGEKDPGLEKKVLFLTSQLQEQVQVKKKKAREVGRGGCEVFQEENDFSIRCVGEEGFGDIYTLERNSDEQ